MKILDVTKSLCPYCFKRIDADIVEDNGKIYMDKTCSDHGKVRVLIWSDASTYQEWGKYSEHAPRNEGGHPTEKECPYDCGYCNEHRGSTCTSVIEVTKRCNMNCSVCFASANAIGDNLSLSKIQEMIDYVAETQGFCSLQISGGEPTLRDDLPEIVSYAKKIGFKHVQVNSNGIRLASDLAYVKSLADAGTDLIYLGFDGIDDGIYEKIRNRKMIDVKKGCIGNCEKAGIGVMLVPVIIKEENDDQIGKIVKFAKAHMPTVKGIHFQPASTFGRYEMTENHENRYTIPDLIHDLETQTDREIIADYIVPRKKKSPYCSFSSTYYLNFDNNLVALTRRDGNISLKVPVMSNSKMEKFARNTNNFTEKYWKQNSVEASNKDSELATFSKRLRTYSLSISAMPFQDVWNIDINRVKGCCVSVIHESLTTIPLCLNYLTDTKGRRLYEEGVCCYESNK
ncbi:radical SAM (seleno)protein TrsS [Anaeromicrobium sediminis]|uniref:Radical SAM core domain-containing protein n=1 Tax=Anaeromicrobium sediminis TaxID=1478221 RepID=A0A267MMD6_9FIRM|nr:radical SAM (seleno)protein TrsS [Anaeromicrobium sediminis]PAB60572.1 hypothetical protein CCE28_03235 [Anaeromicrobium sediminis]